MRSVDSEICEPKRIVNAAAPLDPMNYGSRDDTRLLQAKMSAEVKSGKRARKAESRKPGGTHKTLVNSEAHIPSECVALASI